MQDNEKKPALRFKGFTDPWEQRKLGEIAVFSKGVGYSKNDLCEEGTPIILYGRLYTKYETCVFDVDTFVKEKAGSVYSKGGEVIVPASGETAEDISIASVVVKPGILLGGDLNIVSPTAEYDSAFLALTISSGATHKYLSSLAQGKSVVHLHNSDIQSVSAKFPTKREQEKIHLIFGKIDTLITLHQRKYEKLVNIKKSMLDKMFPKNGASVPEIRFKGFTDLWEQREFEEIAVRSSVMSDKKGLPRVEYEDIISGAGRLNKDIKLKESEKVGIVFHKGDVLYGKLRPYLQNWLLATFNGLAVGDFWVLQPQNTDSSFLYRLVQSQQFDGVANQSTGTKMPRADWKLVSKTKFAMPHSVDEQAAIGAYFEHLDTLITLHQRKLEKLQNIKKSCLEKMFV